MNFFGRFEKWGVFVLGAVSLALIVNLVIQYQRLGAESKRPVINRVAAKNRGLKPAGAKTSPKAKVNAPASAQAAGAKPVGKPAGKVPDELARYDSVLEVDLLKKYEERPLPELDRNPFAFVTAPLPVAQVQSPSAPPQPQAPPPPLVTLTVMGYSEGSAGASEAMVSDQDQVFVVHAGDSVGTRYKILKITATAVTVEDSASHQTVDLPVPQ